MSTRKIIDAKHNGEKVWLKGHAQAIFMSDGSTVEDAINNIENVDLEGYATEEWVNNKNYATEYDLKTIDYSSINNTPTTEDITGELNIADENGNIGMKVSSEAVYAKDFVASEHKLSEKANKDYVDNSIAELVDGAPETLNTLNEISAALKDNADIVDVLNQSIGNKQDAITDLETIRQGAAKGATALQSYTEQYKGTVTGVKVNGTTKNPSNGVVDLGTVITSHQDISGKQDKLVSGTNIKTINGTSILGSGNITIEGGTGNCDANVKAVDEISTIIDVDLNKYIVETTDDNITLDNNKYYKKTNVSSSVSITLNMPEDNTVFTSFSIEFTTSETGTSVSLPDSVKWLNGELPIFENNFTYQISICNGLGVCAKYA